MAWNILRWLAFGSLFILRWLVYGGLFILLLGFLYFSSWEAYVWLTQSDVKAQAAAEAMFKKICGREGLDPDSFSGPQRPSLQSDKKLDTYTFLWSRAPEETISVSVVYLPYDLPYSISQALIEAKHGVKSSR